MTVACLIAISGPTDCRAAADAIKRLRPCSGAAAAAFPVVPQQLGCCERPDAHRPVVFCAAKLEKALGHWVLCRS